MRALWMPLVGLVILVVRASLPLVVLAQDEGDPRMRPPVEFTATLACGWTGLDGPASSVIVGPVEGGNLVRQASRGTWHPYVLEVSDPRFDGRYEYRYRIDEYYHPGLRIDDMPTLAAGVLRIENDDGTWQGEDRTFELPGGNAGAPTRIVLTGARDYEGLTAAFEMHPLDDDQGCRWEVSGFLFEGEPPSVPASPTE